MSFEDDDSVGEEPTNIEVEVEVEVENDNAPLRWHALTTEVEKTDRTLRPTGN